MAKLWRKTTDATGQAQMQEVNLGRLNVTTPTVIYLSGFLTTDGNTANVQEGTDCVADFLDQAQSDFREKPDVLVWSHTRLSNLFNIAAYNTVPEGSYSASAMKLARGLILPLVTDANGSPLPAEDAKRRLRNITFLGYSAGTVVAQETYNASLHLMRKAGYAEADARGVLKEIVLVSTGNMSNPTAEKNRFTSIYLAANNDFFVRWRNRIWNPLRTLFSHFARRLSIKKLSDTSLLVTAAIKRKFWHWRKKPDGSRERRTIIPQIPAWTLLATHHELPHYITNDESHNPFARIALNAVVNAVNRQGTPDVEKLLKPIPSTPGDDAIAYRAKILRATKTA